MTFKHYLNFITLPEVGIIEIAEAIGFDKSSYKVKQDDKRFGRDIIIANEDSELTFTRDFFEQLSITQILPSGEIINNASLGFDYLIDIFNNEGYEGKIEYIIQKNDVTFSTGIFSYATASVEFDNIKVKIIQNTNREIIKRLEDTDVDAFNDKALDDRAITPCETTNILLKAKPIVQISDWEMSGANTFNSMLGDFVNPNMNLIRYEVDASFTPFERRINTNFVDAINNFTYLYAKTDLTNGKAIFKINCILKYRPNSSSDTSGRFILNLYKYTRPYDIDTLVIVPVYEKTFSGSSNQDFLVDEEITVNIPPLNIGDCLSTWWADQFIATVPILDMGIIFNEYSMNFNFTSTAIDTVVKGVRLIDLVRHNIQSLADVTTIAPDYDLGGEHYNNFAFNGLLLGQITDKPFNNKFKDLIGFTEETCSDYQINPTTVEILPYSGFYADELIAEFDELPSFSTNTKYNKRYTLKTADFKYKRSSDNRETNGVNSIDDVHTETQKFITTTVDSNLKVEVNHIRSAFLIEEARKRAFDNQQTTSLQNDDNLFLLKCVPLAPSSQGGFGAVLLMQETDEGNLQILNNNTDGDGIDFNWTLLGFSVGSQFFIDSSENIGTWQVVSITNTLLELLPVSTTVSFEGEAYITMRWFFTNVLLTNQTNEGYTLVEGVANPTKYSNLDYHWARNIQRWYPYLATATKFKPTDVIKTASFKTNGLLVTRKTGESESLADSGDITNSIIATEKILNPQIHSIKVYADFDKVTQLIEDVQNIKGYVKINLNDGRTVKGFVKELDYSWIKEELDLEIEEKFEGDFMEITESGIIYPQYPEKNNLKSFQINNNFVVLFTTFDVQMYPPIRFTKIKINGVQFTDITEFTDALTELIG